MRCYRTLLVGEAPNDRGGAPLRERIGDVLLASSGLSAMAFDRVFARTNVFERYPGRLGKGAAFPIKHAQIRATQLRRRCRSRVVVLLGKRTARAFGITVKYFDEARIGQCRAFVVPHPSGINRWWNDVNNRARFATFMKEQAHMAKKALKNGEGKPSKRKGVPLSDAHKAEVSKSIKAWWAKRRAASITTTNE